MSESPPPDDIPSGNPAYTPGAAPIPPPQPPTTQFPPVNYAPPGYTPDYGQGYQYPYPPQQYAPPPRKSNAPLIAVVVAVALLLCGGVATAGLLIAHNVKAKAQEAVKPLTDPTLPDIPNLPDGGLPTDLPTDSGRQIQVTYEVTGDGPAQIIYLPKLGESVAHVDDVKLPWRFTATMETPMLLSVFAMRIGSEDGSITCRTLIDGKEVKKVDAGPNGFATAACSYFALD